MTHPTHRKRGYNAACVQWLKFNDDMLAIIEMLKAKGHEAQKYGNQIMIRYGDDRTRNIETMNIGDWLVQGENLEIKVRTNDKFEKEYEVI